MIALLLAFGLLFQTATAPAPLTVQQVLEAHQAGVSAQGLLNMIAANASIAPATEDDLLRLTQGGVSPAVVDAYRARLAPPVAPPPSGPEDPRLADIAKLVRAGLSEELIVRQIRSSGEVFKLSIADMIYLKDNQVPEAIIAALISTPDFHAPAAAPKTSTFSPLIRMRGFLKKDAPGTLNMREGRLEWLDGKKVERNFALEIASIKTSWLQCSPRPQGNFCYALGLELFNGDTYEFRDLEWEAGGNTQILALIDALKKAYPQIVYHERVQ